MPTVRRFELQRTIFLAAALGALLVTGCGDGRPRRVPVSGQVLIDEKPLAGGFIRLIPSDARAAHGEIGPDGRFSLTTFDPDDGCVVGTHQVTVSSVGQAGANGKSLTPSKYLYPTDLTATIDGPTDSLVIRLTWEGSETSEDNSIITTGDADPTIVD